MVFMTTDVVLKTNRLTFILFFIFYFIFFLFLCICVRVSLLHYFQRQGGYVFIFTGALVCLFVCFLAEIRKN